MEKPAVGASDGLGTVGSQAGTVSTTDAGVGAIEWGRLTATDGVSDPFTEERQRQFH